MNSQSRKEEASSSIHSSAVSNVVNDLIRSSFGSEAQNIADKDLDKYIADLILKEAEAKRKKYDAIGVRAYLPDTGVPPNNLPKPNKRFLLNMVRATDSHNQALLREQQRSKRKQDDDDRETEVNRKRRRHRHHHDDDDDKERRHNRSRSPNRRRHRRDRDDTEEDDEHDLSRSLDRRRSPSPLPTRSEKQPVVRGRGKVGSSHMDAHFSKHYDPAYDIESDLDELIMTEYPDDASTSTKKKKKKEKKEKKHKSKKKKKKRKHGGHDSDSGSGTDVWVEEPPKPRAWDIGKEEAF